LSENINIIRKITEALLNVGKEAGLEAAQTHSTGIYEFISCYQNE
jgi:hypothetical protein